MRAFISDFDATIYLHEKDFHGFLEEDIQAIQAFQQEGNLFGICTGRAYCDLMDALPPTIKPDFCIVSSGAMIVDMKDIPIFYEKKIIPSSIIFDIFQYLKDKGIVLIHTDKQIYSYHRPVPKEIEIVINNENDILALEPIGISIHTKDADTARQLTNELEKSFGKHIKPFQNINTIDIVRKDCSKGTGVASAKEIFHITTTYGIGDSFNDIPLLKASDTSFTFHRAPLSVQIEADNVVQTVHEALIHIK